jgi:deoxyadenosine/deoxycytidine kinase
MAANINEIYKMGNLLSTDTRSDPEEILAGLIPMPRRGQKPTRIISLDGNIGVGKTTLLEHIRKRFPNVVIVPEPVDTWTRLKDEQGRNLLQLFYQDKRRWAFSFQQAAMLSRLLLLQKAVADAAPGQIILSERSVLTDRYVFADMLRASGDLTALEWDLYQSWFNAFASQLPIAGILYINTGVNTAYERIKQRARVGEDTISKEYLEALDKQHRAWIANTQLSKQEISTETGTDINATMNALEEFFERA